MTAFRLVAAAACLLAAGAVWNMFGYVPDAPVPDRVLAHLAPDFASTPVRAEEPTQPLVPPPPLGIPTVLILSPLAFSKDYLDGFFANMRALTYPHAAISVGFLHSGGTKGPDGVAPNSSTWNRYVCVSLRARAPLPRCHVALSWWHARG